MTRSTLARRAGLAAAAVTLAFLTTPLVAAPGKCVGVESGPGEQSAAKSLLNLDKDGVAIQGYDPVAYFTDSRAVKGNSAFRASHAGAVYYFASSEHKSTFEADPARYEPLYGGWCAYAVSIDKLSPIDPEKWEIVDGRLILQHNQRAWDLWHKDVAGNFAKADAGWPGLVERNGAPTRMLLNIDESGLALQGYDPTAYFIDGRPRKGDPSLERVYQGATYRFVDEDHKNAFERDPAKYAPMFGGFCGYAASIGKVSPVDPQIWQLVDDRLVLQHTDDAFRLFNKDAAGNFAKADRNWPGLSRRRCK